MLLALPALALSTLLQVLSPNATASVSQASLTLAVTLHGMEMAQFIDDHSTVEALAGYALTEVERSLQMSSPTDVLFYTAPVGAYVWKSSPALRSHTRAAVSFTRLASNVILDTLSGPLGFPDLSLPFEPTVFAPLDSLNPVFNASSIVEPPRPVYGPEWEWSPRDLIVFAPQPACSVPFLTYDMTTASSIGRCGLGPERSTVLDNFIPVYTPPPTGTISIPTGSLVLSELLESCDSTLVDRRRIRLLRFALVVLAVVGQCCSWYAVLHGQVLNVTVPLDKHSSKPLHSSERNSDAIGHGSNDLPPLGPDTSHSSFNQPDSVAPNFHDASNDCPVQASILPEPDTPRLGDAPHPAYEDAPVVDAATETPTLELDPRTLVAENADEGAEISVECVGQVIQTCKKPIKAVATFSRSAHKDPFEKISKDEGKRSVGIVEEDIFESTRALAASLARQKREDRWIARAQRPTLAPKPKPKPSRAVDEEAAKLCLGRRDTDEADSNGDEKDGGGMRRNSDGAKAGKIHLSASREEGRQTTGGEERRWAGADVGMLNIEIVGRDLIVEGVPLKRGRRRK